MRRACGAAGACWTGQRVRSGCRAARGAARRAAPHEAAARALTAPAPAGVGVLLRHRRHIGRHRGGPRGGRRSEEHTSELQSRRDLVCRLLLEKKKKKLNSRNNIKKKKKI